MKRFSWSPQNNWAQFFLQFCIVILLINWFSQGMRGMQPKELSFRLLLEAIVVIITTSTLSAQGFRLAFSFLAAMIFAHSLNYFFNGQFWVCARYCSTYWRQPKTIDLFFDRILTWLAQTHWIEEAVCIGSQGKASGTRTPRSDIDLRIVFGSGTKNWFRTNLLMLRLRTSAFLLRIPLDLYGYDAVSALDQFDQEEPLFVIKDRQNKIFQRYYFRNLNFAE
ncbi:MAG: nucleotidyltransferase domain-containing protein [Pseudomonadota bacterium]